jgi:hypothetical protein
MKISETCTCGAKCEVEMQSASAAAHYIKTWRTDHTHQVRNPYTYGSGGAYTPINIPAGEWKISNKSSTIPEPPEPFAKPDAA